MSEWAKALGFEVISPASWRCVPRRVSAWAKARRPAALSTPGGLGRYWAAQWHLARAVGKRFRGCRAKRLYLHNPHLCGGWVGCSRTPIQKKSEISMKKPLEKPKKPLEKPKKPLENPKSCWNFF